MIRDAAFVIVSGQWFPVANAGTVNLTIRENKIESFALNGERRLLIPMNSKGARSWEVDSSPVPAKWADSVGVLKVLSDRGTVVSWVPPLARYSNLLYESWDNGDRSIRTVDGYLGEGSNLSGSAKSGLAPVVVGQTYCFSVVRASGQTAPYLEFLGLNGARVGSTKVLGGDAGESRRFATAVAPAGAVHARIVVPNGLQFFAPAISQGENLNPYSLPGSCRSAVVSLSNLQHGRLRSSRSFSFTVREV